MQNFKELIAFLLFFLVMVAGVAFVAFILVGLVQLLLPAGNPVAQARKKKRLTTTLTILGISTAVMILGTMTCSMLGHLKM